MLQITWVSTANSMLSPVLAKGGLAPQSSLDMDVLIYCLDKRVSVERYLTVPHSTLVALLA